MLMWYGNLVQLIKFTGKIVKPRGRERNALIKYIRRSVIKSETILSIGKQSDEDLFTLRQLAGNNGRVISFTAEPAIYHELFQLKKLLRWKNVFIEQMEFSSSADQLTVDIPLIKRDPSMGAIVINFKERTSFKKAELANNRLDNYCSARSIQPDFISINMAGKELNILKGAENTLWRYKPKVMVVCEEKLAGRKKILETFKYLQDLKYNGFFILDTMRIPLQNFDFNIYQNIHSDFYCNTFIFE